MLLRWFAAGFALAFVLSSMVSEAFALGKPSAADYRRDLNRAAKVCGMTLPEWNRCLDQTQSPRQNEEYLRFVDGGSERLDAALRARGVSKLAFTASRHLKCELSDELLRTHPDAVGIQILLLKSLGQRTQEELVPAEIRIETVPADLLEQGIQNRIEMQGGALVLRAAFGSCSSLETDAQETGARSVFLSYDMGRKLFRR